MNALATRWLPASAAGIVLAVLLTGISAGQQADDLPSIDDDHAFQGEYSGDLDTDDGTIPYGVQIIALGKGEFQAVAYPGGLPGDGWIGSEIIRPAETGRRDGDRVIFNTEHGEAVLVDGQLHLTSPDGEPMGSLDRVERRSRTLGKRPLEGAVVLFDGTSAEGWTNGRMTENGLLMPGTTSMATFGSHQLHIEFLLPYQPEARGQGRGNSGIYMQGRYEVQMLDSFGLEGLHNECGGIYSVKAPDLNMCYPPMTWQTYDIEYIAARYDDDGNLVSNPRMTVLHNGVKIHDNVELPGERNTTAAPLAAGGEPGPVYLQDHGNPVRYRNIWVKPIDD